MTLKIQTEVKTVHNFEAAKSVLKTRRANWLALSASALAMILPVETAMAQNVAEGTIIFLGDQCVDGQLATADKSCITEVKYLGAPGLTLEQAKVRLAEDGLRLATREEIKMAWDAKLLDSYGYGMMADGKFAIPVQRDYSNFKKGVNFGATGGNQGLFYVKASIAPPPVDPALANLSVNPITPMAVCDEGKKPINETTCAAEIYFHKTYLSFETGLKDAMVQARERGWVLASENEIRAAWNAGWLDIPFTGRYQGGGRATPVQSDLNSKIPAGPNFNNMSSLVTGFFYVKEEHVSRVQALPVQFVAPDWWPASPLSTAAGGGLPGSTWRDIPRPTYAGIWSSNPSDQHPAKALFGLGDARLMRDAARQQLKKNGKPATASAIDAHLQTLRSDPVARYQFSPFLLGEAFEALSTLNPNATQAAFRKVFELYMSYESYRVNGITYDRWRDFNGANPYVSKPGYGYGVTAANFLPKIPNAGQFIQQNDNSMGISSQGLAAIRLLLEPAAAASTPEFKNSPYGQIGADMNAIAASVAIGSTAGMSAATLGLVSTAVFGFTTTLSATTVTIPPVISASGAILVASSSSIVKTSGVLTPAALIAKGNLGLTGATTASAGAGIGVVIAVAMAALIAKSFADLASSDALDRELRTKLDAGPQPVDVYSLVTSGSAGDRQINRSAVFSHLLKMMIADPVEKGLLTIKQPELAPMPAPIVSSANGVVTPVPGFVRLQNNWYKDLYIHNEGQQLSLGEIKENWWSAMWKKVPTGGGYYLLQSRYRPTEYLHIQNGKLELGEIASQGWWSAQWKEIPVGGGWVQIQNRWKPDIHLNNTSGPTGKLEAIPVQPNWASSKWKVE